MSNEEKEQFLVLQETQARKLLKSNFGLFSEPLPSESDLTAGWGDSATVIASIACATFNHGHFLEDAIRSFILQKTSFRFEIVIYDDASSDSSVDVINYYRKLYPQIIRAQVNAENQFKRGRMPFVEDWEKMISGKYIAFCEGDDFWIDRDKLQDQILQLERNPEVVISVAGTLCHHVSDNVSREDGVVGDETIYSELAPNYHHTSTFLIKRQAYATVIEKQKRFRVYGDTAQRQLLVDQGKCICLPRVVSVYWISQKGIWTSLSEAKKSKAHVVIFYGLMRAVSNNRKISIALRFVHACADYFPHSVRGRDWMYILLCFIPYLIKKVRTALGAF